MIAERIPQQDNAFPAASSKYYQISSILEHMIDCFHTIVSDETNPYHPPLGWLTRRQPKPPDDELFLDLMDEIVKNSPQPNSGTKANEGVQLSSSVRTRLEKCPQQLRKEIVSRTRNGSPPLFLACRNGLTRVIKYLLDVCDANIEQKGYFEAFEDHHVHHVAPIWVAAVSGQLDVVKLLIDRGADVNSISDTGSTPIRSVCFLCRDDDGFQEYDNLADDTITFGGVVEDENEPDIYMKIVRLLVENGADILKANDSGGTCLINSLHNHRLTAYIISHGADVNSIDNHSKTALHYAILQDRLEVAKLLLKSGADPYSSTNSCDDALQLCCIGGHVDIFNHLIENYAYSHKRLADAYKLLGSSIFELHYDLPIVRKYWTKSLEIWDHQSVEVPQSELKDEKTIASTSQASTSRTDGNNSKSTTMITKSQGQQSKRQVIIASGDNDKSGVRNICDMRRSLAYGDAIELASTRDLNQLSMDDYRIQSLLISERVLGRTHRETIQRLLYRGTFYVNSMRPNRCLDLWIYALSLRLESDSIYNFESIFAAQAVTKFFLDLYSQRQYQQVKFKDVHDVTSMLVSKLRECQQHKDILDLLLSMIVNLLLLLRCSQREQGDRQLTSSVTRELSELNPRTSKGLSLLHLCVASNMFEGETHRSLLVASETMQADDDNVLGGGPEQAATQARSSPLYNLIDNLISAGSDVDSVNNEGLSVLQTICLATNIRTTDRKQIVELLVRNGAHIDRRALSVEQGEQIKQALRESGVNLIEFESLKCLAARAVSATTPKPLARAIRSKLSKNLQELIAIH